MNGWAGRKGLFTTGQRFKVLKPFVASPEPAPPGEIITFVEAAYSPYDGSWVYSFTSPTGAPRSWWLHDSDPSDSWHDYLDVPINLD